MRRLCLFEFHAHSARLIYRGCQRGLQPSLQNACLLLRWRANGRRPAGGGMHVCIALRTARCVGWLSITHPQARIAHAHAHQRCTQRSSSGGSMAKRKAAAPAAEEGGSKQQKPKQQRKQQPTAPADEEGPSTSGKGSVVAAAGQPAAFKNKEKVLLLSSRGITYRWVPQAPPCMHHMRRRRQPPPTGAACCLLLPPLTHTQQHATKLVLPMMPHLPCRAEMPLLPAAAASLVLAALTARGLPRPPSSQLPAPDAGPGAAAASRQKGCQAGHQVGAGGHQRGGRPQGAGAVQGRGQGSTALLCKRLCRLASAAASACRQLRCLQMPPPALPYPRPLLAFLPPCRAAPACCTLRPASTRTCTCGWPRRRGGPQPSSTSQTVRGRGAGGRGRGKTRWGGGWGWGWGWGLCRQRTADWHDCTWLGQEVEGTAAVPPALHHCPLLLPLLRPWCSPLQCTRLRS